MDGRAEGMRRLALNLLVLAVSASCPSGFAGNDLPQRTEKHLSIEFIKMADDCLRQKKFADAESNYKKALEIAEQLRLDNERSQKRSIAIMPSMVPIFVGLAEVYERTKRADLAEKTLVRAAEAVMKEEPAGYRCIMSPAAFDALARFYEHQKRTAEAEKWYALVQNMNCNAHAYGVQAQSLKRYGSLLLSTGRHKQAWDVNHKADELLRTKKRLDHSGSDY